MCAVWQTMKNHLSTNVGNGLASHLSSPLLRSGQASGAGARPNTDRREASAIATDTTTTAATHTPSRQHSCRPQHDSRPRG